MIRKTRTRRTRRPRVSDALPSPSRVVRCSRSLYTSRADSLLALMLSLFLSSKLVFFFSMMERGKQARVFGTAGREPTLDLIQSTGLPSRRRSCVFRTETAPQIGRPVSALHPTPNCTRADSSTTTSIETSSRVVHRHPRVSDPLSSPLKKCDGLSEARVSRPAPARASH